MASYDAETARSLLERAIGMTTNPALSETDVDLLMSIIGDTQADFSITYTSAQLNTAAALGWEWKANQVTDKYDIGGGAGKYLTQSQWWEHCRSTAADYRNGAKTIDGATTGTGPRGFGVVAITGELGGVY